MADALNLFKDFTPGAYGIWGLVLMIAFLARAQAGER